MNERIATHALWAGALMYGVAVGAWAAVACVRLSRGHDDVADAFAAKAVALFGPIVSIVGLVVARARKPGGTP